MSASVSSKYSSKRSSKRGDWLQPDMLGRLYVLFVNVSTAHSHASSVMQPTNLCSCRPSLHT